MILPEMPSSNPVEIPEETIEAKTFDKLWLCGLEISAEDVNGQGADVHAILKPFRELSDETHEAAPDTSGRKDINIRNAFELAQQREVDGKPTLINALSSLLEAIKEIGQEQGVIAADE